ncbi:hypothetical protein CEXT_302841 [Caerostris extrusa]|uniref:Uncharacterized protein n=1 Tax=Caerostris extrusa TaxID=172846 RepID=A0AAV4XVE9_CAEEX|nr:hypothetical protein CEXT_302841 [Caerostris extrusa]
MGLQRQESDGIFTIGLTAPTKEFPDIWASNDFTPKRIPTALGVTLTETSSFKQKFENPSSSMRPGPG